jgi:DNA-binding NarL/FixJ family response regulator
MAHPLSTVHNSAVLVKVAIVEDNAGIRENWAKMINATPGFRCAGTFSSAEAALKEIPLIQPDVVLMDINLPRMSGIECTGRLKEQLPRLQIMVVTVHADNDRVFSALQAGASGYLLKRTGPAELLEAIQEVTRGGVPMTGEIARKVIATFRRPATPPIEEARLTRREEEILILLTQGYANKEIADRLAVSFDTVRTHLCHIYEKLHVRSRTEAATKYLRATESAGIGAAASERA